MNTEHNPNAHDTVPTHSDTRHREIVTNVDRPPLLSWGSIMGGLVCVIAISWLLYLLGMALGVSIADLTDGEAIGAGLTTGAIVWIVLSSLVAYFVGSLITARLSGKVDSTAGMLHGMTLWGVATTLMVVLSYMGITSLLQTGYSVMQTTVSTASAMTSEVASGLYATGETVVDAADTRLADNIQARLKRRAASVVSRMDKPGGPQVTADEVRAAIDGLSQEELQDIATHLAMGELTTARETIANATSLSENEVRDIVNGIANEFEEQLGMADNSTDLNGDIINAIKRQAADLAADLDSSGGAEVTQRDIRRALDQLSPETMQTVAYRLAQGDVQGAKDNLAANTNLTTRQINDIVNGVNEDVSRTVEKYQRMASDGIAAATDYTQAVLWTAFVAAAMGLGVCMLGGWLGAETSRRLRIELETEVDKNRVHVETI